MHNFTRINNIGGWIVFAISTLVYILTMESSASFWDCGEFIAASYKLQVVHPPGAPLFLMIGRFFSLFAFGNVENVPLMLNLMSGVSTAAAMMFLFWIVTYLGRRLLDIDIKSGFVPKSAAFAILGAGFVAALAGTFADSIWFSAVEGEVYAMSLFFTALVVWLMFKWEAHADEPYADRYLILIAFLMGCSIGVHWLNLLAIPMMAFLYYFKRFKFSILGLVITALASVVLLGFVQSFVILKIVGAAAWFEKLMVNSMGMPFNVGLYIFIILFVLAVMAGLWYLNKRNLALAFNGLLAFAMMMIGFSVIATTVIRSNADTPINMNAPKDAVQLMTFLKREQYGERPLLSGPYYYSKPYDVDYYAKSYAKGKDKYDQVGEKFRYKYREADQIFFPRMHSSDENHIKRYENWVGLKKGQKPTYGDNLEFFFKYQLGWMYKRYLFWNFVGRQNDKQGLGGPKDGNWLSGISFMDEGRLGPQDTIPLSAQSNKGRNKFYFIPFLLGLLGAVFMAFKDPRRFFAVLVLFAFMGVILIVYGNSPPVEPRERDYIFAGSFWTFCIWIGLSAVAMFSLLRGVFDKEENLEQKAVSNGNPVPAFIAIAIAAIAPFLMGSQGWDDHTRNGRTVARDFAKNYLESVEPNAILFTQGDNDTYPLWYAQEVEGIRRDVRIVNLSLLGVDWYINQLRRPINDAQPVDMTLTPSDYRGDKRNFVSYSANERIAPAEKFINLMDVVKFIANDSRNAKRQTAGGGSRNYYPTKKFSLPVDINDIKKHKVVTPNDYDKVTGDIKWQLNRNTMLKNDIMTLDIIATNAAQNWKRPIYFAVSINPSSFLGLQKYFQIEGFAYRLVPIKSDEKGYTGRIHNEKMYDNMMNDFTFGGLENGVYADETISRMVSNLRGNYARLAGSLAKAGEIKKAEQVLDKAVEGLSHESVPYDFYSLFIVESYYECGAKEKAKQVGEKMLAELDSNLRYIRSLPSDLRKSFDRDRQLAEMGIQRVAALAQTNGQNAWVKELEEKYGL